MRDFQQALDSGQLTAEGDDELDDEDLEADNHMDAEGEAGGGGEDEAEGEGEGAN
jgi:hypothetical protein